MKNLPGLNFFARLNFLTVLYCGFIYSEVLTLKREIKSIGLRCSMLPTLDIRIWSSCWLHMAPMSMQCM